MDSRQPPPLPEGVRLTEPMSTSRAARFLGVSASALLDRVAAGSLKATKVGRTWMVNWQAIQACPNLPEPLPERAPLEPRKRHEVQVELDHNLVQVHSGPCVLYDLRNDGPLVPANTPTAIYVYDLASSDAPPSLIPWVTRRMDGFGPVLPIGGPVRFERGIAAHIVKPHDLLLGTDDERVPRPPAPFTFLLMSGGKGDEDK